MNDFTAAIAAIHNRSPDDLASALTSLEEAEQFRNEVLPLLEPADCRWFWAETLTKSQFKRISSMVVDVAAAVAKTEGFVLGRDFSVGVDESGLAQLLCREVVLSRVVAKLPLERRSVLRALVQVLPG